MRYLSILPTRTVLTISLFTISLGLAAQWSQQISPVTNIHSVYFVDSIRGFAGGQTKILKTIDGGINWNSLAFTGPDSTRMKLAYYHGLYFYDRDSGVAVGKSLLDNGTFIIRTTNAGITWTTVHLIPNTGATIRSVHFASALVGVAVGDGGRIYRTTNGGITWASVTSGTTSDLSGIHFADATTGYAVGNTKVLKTTDGGATWAVSTIAYSPSSVFFTSPSTGYAPCFNSGIILKTSNGGNSWSATNTYTGNNSLTSVHFTNALTGYVCGTSTLLKTTDGGIFWETMPFTPSNADLRGIFFPTQNTGYTVGYNGIILKTTNAGGLTAPVASFNMPTVLCADSAITFTSNGPSNYTYLWKDNGVPFSTAYSTTRSFAANTTHTIELIVTNNNFSDTASNTFTTPSSLYINLISNPVNDTLCMNTAASIQVFNSQPGVWYRLRQGTTQIGSTLNGNGGTLTFNTAALNNTTTFNIHSSIINSCGTNTVINYHTIYIIPVPNLILSVVPVRPLICYNDTTHIKVISSQVNVMYRLRILNNTVGVPQMGNGGTLYFPTPQLTANTTFNVFTTNLAGCGYQITQTATVNIRFLNVTFSTSDSTISVGDSIAFSNPSNADSYIWDFDNGIPQTSTLSNPGFVRYPSLGVDTITLIGNTTVGCIDTAMARITVLNGAPIGPGDTCFWNSSLTRKYIVSDYHQDANHFNYITGYYCVWNNSPTYFVAKLDPSGNIIWNYESAYGSSSKSSYGTGITTDLAGNVYVCGHYWGTAGKVGPNNTFTNSNSSNTVQMFVVKYSPSGSVLWAFQGVSQTTTSGQIGASDIASYGNKIYVTGTKNTVANFRLFLPNSSTFDIGPGNDSFIFELSSSGAVVNSTQFGAYSAYTFSKGSQNVNYNGNPVKDRLWVNPKLKIDATGNIYVGGSFYSLWNSQVPYSFGSLTIQNSPQFLSAWYWAKLNFQQGWLKAVKVAETATADQNGQFVRGIAFDNDGNVFVAGHLNGYTHIGADTFYISTPSYLSSFLTKSDTSGTTLWHTETRAIRMHDIEVTRSGSVVFAAMIKKTGVLYSQTVPEVTMGSPLDVSDIALGEFSSNGDLMWAHAYGAGLYDLPYFIEKDSCDDIYLCGKADLEYDVWPVYYNTDILTSGNLLFSKFALDAECNKVGCLPMSPTSDTIIVFSPTSITNSVCENGSLSIAWGTNNVGAVNLFYSPDSGNIVYPIAVNLSSTSSPYLWSIPPSFQPGDTVYIVVSDTASGGQIVITNGIVVTGPVVSYTETNVLTCLNAPAFALTPGIPSGGVYSGPGVTGNQFNPTAAGVGTWNIVYSFTDSSGCGNSDTSQITVNLCTDIYNPQGGTVSIYPNPFTEMLTLETTFLGEGELNIYTTTGERIGTWKLMGGLLTIDTRDLPNGVYFVQVKSGNGLVTRKLIKNQ